MTEKRAITVIGSLIHDFVAFADRMPAQGETVRGTGFRMSTGGKGANQAVQVGRLGVDCYMVGMIGHDFMGEALKESLYRSNVKTDYVFTHPDAQTGACCIFVDAAGENRIIMVPQANDEFHPEYLARVVPPIERAGTILLQLEIPMPTVEAVIAMAKKKGKTVIMNPAPYRPLGINLLNRVDILTPNLTEAAALLDLPAKDIPLAALAGGLRGLNMRGAIVVTLGAKGAMIVTPSNNLLVPAYPVKAVDETAAGDAFNGALAVALMEGRSLIEAVKFANAAGAVAAMREGAQPSIGRREEIEALIAAHPPLRETVL